MAKYFVNRGGGRVPEGPFEEQQIERLILAGKLKAGYVCEEGLQRFTPLEDHPPFRQALAQAGITPAPEGLAARARPAAGQQKGTNRAMLFGAVLAFFGLAIGAVAIGTYVMFNTGGMPAHAAMPSDTELLFEIASVRGTVANLSMVRGLDTKKLALLDNTTTALSASFGVPKARVSALMLAASSLGVGARKLASAPEGGVVLSFSSATPVNAFLSSKRFTYYGLVSTNGRKYKVSAAATEVSASDATTKELSELKLDDPRTLLVWFETSKVLFVGSAGFASDVSRALSLDAPSLDLNANFKNAQHDWQGKPDGIMYFDPTHVADAAPSQAMFGAALKNAAPASASFRLVPAGLLTHLVARFNAKDTPPDAASLTAAPGVALTITDRLPSETFAYVAAATGTGLSGADLRRSMLAQIQKGDPAVAGRVTAELAHAEAELHVSFDQLLGSIGDQGALALLAPPDYSIELANPYQAAARFAVVYVQTLKDEAPGRALFAQLKTQFEQRHGPALIHEDADGYSATPTDNALGVSLQLRFSKGYLYLAVGNSALVERSMRAFASAEGTLGTEPAHRAARAALPSSAQVIAWVDLGRIVNTVQQNPLFSPRLHDLGLNHDALRWTGPDRLTTALALSGELHSGVYAYRVDVLNLPVFTAFLRAPP